MTEAKCQSLWIPGQAHSDGCSVLLVLSGSLILTFLCYDDGTYEAANGVAIVATTTHSGRPRIITIGLVLVLAGCLSLVLFWVSLLYHVRYCGTVQIAFTLDTHTDTESITVKALSLLGNPISPLVKDLTFSFYGSWKTYSRIFIYLPKDSISHLEGIQVLYAGRTFSMTTQELVIATDVPAGAISSGHVLYELPAEVGRATPFLQKNLSLLYTLFSFAFRIGLYKYLIVSFVLIVCSVIAACTWLSLKKTSRHKILHGFTFTDIDSLHWLSATLQYLLALLISGAFILHCVLVFVYGQILATSGFVLYTFCFFVLLWLTQVLLKHHPSSRKNIQLLVAALFVGVLLAEMLLRVSGIHTTYLEQRGAPLYGSYYRPQETGWYHLNAPNKTHYLRTPEYSFHRTTNSLGLSDREFEKTKRPGEYRIIALGDSYTEGDGAPEESTWPRLLLASLQQDYPHRDISCINAGVSGSDPFFEYVLLRDILLAYKPDLVIVAMNEEASDLMVRGGMERFRPDGTVQYRKPPSWEWLYASSHIARLVVHRLLGYDYLFLKPEQRAAEYSRAISLLAESVGLFKDLAEAHHFHLLIVCHPLRSELESGSFYYLQKVLATCRSNHVECLDMLEYFTALEKIDRNSARLYYWERDGHHNARGYAAFARGVRWKLDQMGVFSSIEDTRRSGKIP